MKTTEVFFFFLNRGYTWYVEEIESGNFSSQDVGDEVVGRLPDFWLGMWCHQTGYRKKSGFKGGCGSFRTSSAELSGPRMTLWVTPSTKGRMTQRDGARNREPVVTPRRSAASRRKTNSKLTCGREVWWGKDWKMPTRCRQQDARRTSVKSINMSAKLWELKSGHGEWGGEGEARRREVQLRSRQVEKQRSRWGLGWFVFTISWNLTT